MVGGGVAWALMAGLYLVLAGTLSVSEGVAAALAGFLAALLSVAVRRTGERRFRFRGVPWPRLLVKPAQTLVSDTARVGAVLVRAVLRGPGVHDAPDGATARQNFARGGDDAQDAARRGLVTLAVSLTPNSYVLRIMDARDEMRLHRLAERKQSASRVWPL